MKDKLILDIVLQVNGKILIRSLLPPKPVKNVEKHQRALLSHSLMLISFVVKCAAQTQHRPHLCPSSIFPGINGRQTGKKNDWNALLIPLRSEFYLRGCGYYLSSSKSACLVIIRAWDRNLS